MLTKATCITLKTSGKSHRKWAKILEDETKKIILKKRKTNHKTRVNLLINPILIFQTRNLLCFILGLNKEAQPSINLMLNDEITKKIKL